MIHNFELCNIYDVGGNQREYFYNYATSTMLEEGKLIFGMGY